MNIGDFQFSGSEPDITQCKPEQEWRNGNMHAVFCRNPPTIASSVNPEGASGMSYKRVLYLSGVKKLREPEPLLIVCQEQSAFGTTAMGLFDGTGMHMNLGSDAPYDDDEKFISKAFEVIAGRIGEEEASHLRGEAVAIQGVPGAEAYTANNSALTGIGSVGAGVGAAGQEERFGFGYFFRRFIAVLIDYFLAFLIVVVLVIIFYTFFDNPTVDLEQVSSLANGLALLLFWVYSALFESSKSQATLGKLATGLKVTNLARERIGFWRATGRHFGKILSSLLFFIGYLMIFFTKKKQGLHDKMAGCLVVRS